MLPYQSAGGNSPEGELPAIGAPTLTPLSAAGGPATLGGVNRSCAGSFDPRFANAEMPPQPQQEGIEGMQAQFAAVQTQQMHMAAMMQMQMQMGAMAQLQMLQMQMMMGMQMPAVAALPAVLPGVTQQSQPVVMSAEEAEEAAELSRCTADDLALLELKVKDMERKAKEAARIKDGFVGLMARYIEDEGFGFISCAECKDTWDKTDIFVSGRNFMTSGIDVGDVVTFQVEKDGKDLPRACNPKTLQELTRLRKKLIRMREILRPAGAAVKRGFQEVAGGALPVTKRPNVGTSSKVPHQ